MSEQKRCPNGCGPLEPFADTSIGAFGPWGCPACHWVEGNVFERIERRNKDLWDGLKGDDAALLRALEP